MYVGGSDGGHPVSLVAVIPRVNNGSSAVYKKNMESISLY